MTDYSSLAHEIAERQKTDPRSTTISSRALSAEHYFDRIATVARLRWFWFNTALLILAGAVTVVAAVIIIDPEHHSQWAIVSAVLGATIGIIRGVDATQKNHETWLRARSTQQSLLSARIAYQSGTGPFASSKDPLNDYAQRIEAILSGELQDWVTEAKQSQAPAQ